MISFECFISKWIDLEERFGQQRSDKLAKGYYDRLRDKLSDDEFLGACEEVYWGDRFFPTPERFVEAAGKSAEQQGILEWDKILNHPYNPQAHSYPEISPAAYSALKSIGGIHALQTHDPAQRSHLRRDFLATYKAYRSPTAQAMGMKAALPPPPAAVLPAAPPPPLPEVLSEEELEQRRAAFRRGMASAIAEPLSEKELEQRQATFMKGKASAKPKINLAELERQIELERQSFPHGKSSEMTSVSETFEVLKGVPFSQEEEDMGSIAIVIDEHCERLGWSDAEREQAVFNRYQLQHQYQLSNADLVDFCQWLACESSQLAAH